MFFLSCPLVCLRLVLRHSAVRLLKLLLFALLLVFGLFSPLFFFLCLPILVYTFRQSSHHNCGLPRSLQPSCLFVPDLFGNLSSFILTMSWPFCSALINIAGDLASDQSADSIGGGNVCQRARDQCSRGPRRSICVIRFHLQQLYFSSLL